METFEHRLSEWSGKMEGQRVPGRGTACPEGRGSTEHPEAGVRPGELGLERAGVRFGEPGENFPGSSSPD